VLTNIPVLPLTPETAPPPGKAAEALPSWPSAQLPGRPLPPLPPLAPAPAPSQIRIAARRSEPAFAPSPAAEAQPSKEKKALHEVRVVDTAVRVVKSRRFTLNFAVKDVGPSGVSAVEVWYTRDGKEWKMRETPPKPPPYVVEVDEEGRYGFTLRARSGVGLGPKPPGPGDEPQVWVVVDQSRPDVQLLEVTPTRANRSHALVIRWKATDENFGRQPITLSYAEREVGPWYTIAANVFNNGHYIWPLPANLPGQFLVRVEAVDLAGNTGVAQTTTPVVLDNSMPTVSILAVEAGGR
jgi:hypothetical protein